ncbi:MAG: hypothetical protein GY928_08240 [Colwellia sp.]|nr:hypothetical protein [Colwellia sp.]
MITDSYTAMCAILQDNTNITSLLGTYKGTAIPLIKGGVLPESETNMPAITFRVDKGKRTHFLDDQYFIVNCFASNERDSYLLAKAIIDEFNEESVVVDGYNARTTCNTVGEPVNPTANEINTPIEFRIVNI